MLFIFHILSFIGVMFLVIIVLPMLLSSGDTSSFIAGTISAIGLLIYIAYEWWQVIKED